MVIRALIAGADWLEPIKTTVKKRGPLLICILSREGHLKGSACLVKVKAKGSISPDFM